MAGSTFGKQFQITTWGESHGPALGVVIDGCPAGLPLSEELIQPYLDRRKPGQNALSTPRKEEDKAEILSGVFEGKTTGCPISILIRNTSQHSSDYSEIAGYYRPGHADYTFDQKFGFRDHRGGGRSSGRETAARVAAGAVAALFLKELGITLQAYTESIGDVKINPFSCKFDYALTSPTGMPDPEASQRAEELIAKCKEESDSVGGVIRCRVTGLPAGLGEPVFDKLDATLGKAILSIGAVKAFEMGDGILASASRGSQFNDPFCIQNGKVGKLTNHAGGTLGGISDGDDIVFRAFIKPTPSIFQTQKTVNKEGEEIDINIKGRHDPVIVPRAVVVVECMAAITVADAVLCSLGSRMDLIRKFL